MRGLLAYVQSLRVFDRRVLEGEANAGGVSRLRAHIHMASHVVSETQCGSMERRAPQSSFVQRQQRRKPVKLRV